LLVIPGRDLLGAEEASTGIDFQPEQDADQVDEQITLSATNESKQSLFVEFCGRSLIVKIQRFEGSWESHAGTLCADVFTTEFRGVAEPGEIFRFSRSLSTPAKIPGETHTSVWL